MKYRAEIDGLRAISILSVVGFHSNISFLSGGFVGVDTFFVISGFLITSVIRADLDAGRFSFLDFYSRRIVRIVPALVVMTFAVFLLGYVYLYPAELDLLSRSAIYSTLSLSNIYFYATSDYFDVLSNAKPLLNTWSLGVEEQFYLLYPLLLVALFKYRRRYLVHTLAAIGLGSLAVSAYSAYVYPDAAFYLLHSRIWELLVGGLASFLPGSRLATSLPRFLPELGLLGILSSVVLYDSNTTFPGLQALLPCVGCALILVSAEGGSRRTSVGSRLLRLPPMVFIGRISYSLYLWHWPLIVFQRLGPLVHTGLSAACDKIIVVAIIFAVSTASWALVEVPLRRGILGLSRFRLAMNITASAAVVGLVCSSAFLTDGFPGRFSPAAISLAKYLDYDPAADYRTGQCFLTNKYDFRAFDRKVCLAEAPNMKSYLLIGDSHAAALYPGLRSVLDGKVNLLQATATGCKPVLRDIGTATTCAKMDRFIFDDYLRFHPVDLVIISARWDDADLPALTETIRSLSKLHQPTAIMGPTPEFTQPLPRLLALRIQKPAFDILDYLYSGPRDLDKKMAEAVQRDGASYISLYDDLCPLSACVLVVGAAPLYFDATHLTRSASIFLAEKMSHQMPDSPPAPRPPDSTAALR